jgi:hypothetical protein
MENIQIVENNHCQPGNHPQNPEQQYKAEIILKVLNANPVPDVISSLARDIKQKEVGDKDKYTNDSGVL